MKPDSLLRVWTGKAHNTNGWDMKITIPILQPFEVGSTLGIFDIPLIPLYIERQRLGNTGNFAKGN